jgi:hypothetical protein
MTTNGGARSRGRRRFRLKPEDTMTALKGLTLEQVVTRICNGEPLYWLTVHDSNGDVYDMVVDITAQPQMAEGDRPPRS